MKTIVEFGKEMMDKRASNLTMGQLAAFGIIPSAIGGVGGAVHSSFTSPAPRAHEVLQTDLLKERMLNLLKERKEEQKVEKLEEVLNGSQRSIRV